MRKPNLTDDGPATDEKHVVDDEPAADGDVTADADKPASPADPEPADGEPAREQAAAGRSGLLSRITVPASRHGRIVALVVVAALIAGLGGVAWWQLRGLPEDAAFRYDGRVFTAEELDQRVEALRALYGVTPPSDPAQADGFRRDVAKSVALSEILDRAAADRQIVVADKQVSDTLDRYIEQQFGAGGREPFVRALGNVGTSETAVRDEIRRQLAVGRLMQQVVGRVTVPDDELRAVFEERKDRLGTPERRVLRNIVVANEQDATAALDALRSGTPIEEVAAQRSLDVSTRQTGGLLDPLARADLEQPVGDVAFAAPAGGLYGPAQGQHGWNVGRVESVEPFVPATFEQVADGLRRAVEVERTVAIWRDWLAGQIRDADVEYAADFQPADPDTPPSIGPSGADAPAPR
ncbi:peptidyl-prolyl cis-trans isomerase [Pseudonocardia sp. H11422]|uniref:peptidylprolyl isomerase n=1 Tax=Pseudonocardia sp. H11422 TaxID=2835866 RepID=UPI001BDBFBAA|nr:peptidylprolyl isomerase [Pseudonocardia sp. H11422]